MRLSSHRRAPVQPLKYFLKIFLLFFGDSYNRRHQILTYLNMAGIVKEMNMFNWWTFYRNQPEEKKNSRIHDRTLRRRLSPLADGDLKDKFGIKPVTEIGRAHV